MGQRAKACAAKAIKALKGAVEDAQLLEAAEELEKAMDSLRSMPSADVSRQMSLFARNQANNRLIRTLENKRNKIFDILANNEMDGKVRRMLDSGKMKLKDIANAVLIGLERSVEGVKRSVQSIQKALSDGRKRKFISEFNDTPEALSVWRSGDMEKAIYDEVYNPGSSGNKDANFIVKKILSHIEWGRLDLNAAGASIKKLLKYFPRMHDETRILKDKDGWLKFMSEDLDIDETLAPYMPEGLSVEGRANFINEFIEETWINITTGQRNLYLPEVGSGRIGTGKNFAKRLARERVLFFKNADAEFRYNQAYGKGSSFDAVWSRISRDAENIGLLRELGPNPRATVDRIVSRLRNVARKRGDTKAIGAFDSYDVNSNFSTISNNFKEVMGFTDIPINPSYAKIGRIVRMIQNMAKLNKLVLTSIPDMAYIALHARSNGIRVFDTYLEGFKQIKRQFGKTPGKMRDIFDDIGLMSEVLNGEMHSRYYADDVVMGKFGKAHNLFYKFSGMPFWNDAWKSAVTLVAARNLARTKKIKWGALDKFQRNTLSKYGFREADWSVMERTNTRPLDGREYLTPEMVSELSDEVVLKAARAAGDIPSHGLTKKQLSIAANRFRGQLEDKMRTFFIMEADIAVPTPGKRQRAFTRWGTSSGTTMGEAVRFFFQYKVFPITIATEIAPRIFMGGPGGKMDVGGMSQMLLMTSILGYVSITAKDFVSGKTPRSLERFQTYAEAFAQGGGAGIWGDFLLADHTRYGRGMAETFGGPAIGEIGMLIKRIGGPLWGKRALNSGDAIRFTLDNTPFINLYFGRLAQNYLFGWRLAEWARPGTLPRIEKAAKERGQEFIFPKPTVHVRRQQAQ